MQAPLLQMDQRYAHGQVVGAESTGRRALGI